MKQYIVGAFQIKNTTEDAYREGTKSEMRPQRNCSD